MYPFGRFGLSFGTFWLHWAPFRHPFSRFDVDIGNTVTFVNNAVDGANTLTISPAAADGITYAGSSTDNKDLINTKTTSKRGDSVTLASLNGTVAWQVVAVRGTWAKE